MAEKYFGHWRQDAIPALPPSPSEVLARPPPELTRRLDSSAKGGPALMQAFYRPGIASDDAPILDVIGCASLQALLGQQCAPSPCTVEAIRTKSSPGAAPETSLSVSQDPDG